MAVSAMQSMQKWVKTFLFKASYTQREKIVKAVLQGLKRYNTKDGNVTPEGEALFARLVTSGDYELVGVSFDIMYMRVKGTPDQEQAIFHHPWGMPAVILKEKKSCVLLIVNPAIRFNETLVSEVDFNEYQIAMEGLAG